MWHDAASVRIKLKVPATQHHHCKHAAHACWLAISQVRFLYGLPTYSCAGSNLSDKMWNPESWTDTAIHSPSCDWLVLHNTHQPSCHQ